MPDRRATTSPDNGRLSKGPITQTGKDRSKLNAIRHGLLAQHTLFKEEKQENFDILVGDYCARFQPQDGVEDGLIEEMTSAYWRTRRLWALEVGMMNQEVRMQLCNDPLERVVGAFGFLADTPKYKLLLRYEARLHHQHRRAIQTFIELRQKVPLPVPQIDEDLTAVQQPPAEESLVGPSPSCPDQQTHPEKRTTPDAPAALDPLDSHRAA